MFCILYLYIYIITNAFKQWCTYTSVCCSVLTLPAAFLYRLIASSFKSRTRSSPVPHGTTTRIFPKHTVTFIVVIKFVQRVTYTVVREQLTFTSLCVLLYVLNLILITTSDCCVACIENQFDFCSSNENIICNKQTLFILICRYGTLTLR